MQRLGAGGRLFVCLSVCLFAAADDDDDGDGDADVVVVLFVPFTNMYCFAFFLLAPETHSLPFCCRFDVVLYDLFFYASSAMPH